MKKCVLMLLFVVPAGGRAIDKFFKFGFSTDINDMVHFIMHPPQGPKGLGVDPIGATRGVH